MSESRRISRRTRGERPEVVPPKSDEEPDKFLEDDYVDEYGNKIALGALRGRRKRPAVPSSSSTSNDKDNANAANSNSNAASSKGPPHPQQEQQDITTAATTTTTNASNTATTTSTTKKHVRRQHSPTPTPTHNTRRSNSPTPSQSSVNDDPSRNNKRRPNTRSNSPTTPSPSSLQQEEESSMSWSVEEGDNGNDNADNDAENDDDDNKSSSSSSSSSEVENDDGDEEEEESDDDNDCEDSDSDADADSDSDADADADVDADTEDDDDDDDDNIPIALLRQASASSSAGARKKEKKATSVAAVATKKPRKVDVKKKKKKEKSASTSPPLPPIEDDDDDDDDDDDEEKQLLVALKLKFKFKFDPARPYKCRNCGKLYAPQGIKHHERKCMPVYSHRLSKSPDMKKTLSKSNNEDDTNDDIDNDGNDNDHISSDASSSSPVEENEEEGEEEEEENESSSSLSTASPSSSDVDVVVNKGKAKQPPPPPPRKKKSKKTTTTKTATAMYKCRNCNKEFSSRGITRHEKSCMTIYTRRNFPNSREGGGVVATITSTNDELSKSKPKSTIKAKDNDNDDNDEEEKEEDEKNDVDYPSDSDSVVVLPPKRKKRKKIDIHDAVATTSNTTATAAKAKAASVDNQEDEDGNVEEEEEGGGTITESKKDNSVMTWTILRSSKMMKTTGIVVTAGGTSTKDEDGGGTGNTTTIKNNNHNKGGDDESSIPISTTTGKNNTNKDNRKNATSVAATTTVTKKKKSKSIDEFFPVKKKKKTGVVMKPPPTNTKTDQSKSNAAPDGEEGGGKAKKTSKNTKGKIDDEGVTTTTASKMESSESESTTKEVVLMKEEESSNNEFVVAVSARGAAVVTTTKENVTDNNSIAVNINSTSSPPIEDNDDDDDDDDGEPAESSSIHMITKTKNKTEEEDRPMNKTTSTRPTRKRKLTPKAAAQQAAVAVATEATITAAAAAAAVVVANASDEESLFDDDSETDGDYGSDSVVHREKKEPKKSEDNDNDGSIVSTNSGGGAPPPPPPHDESNNMEEEQIIGGSDDRVCTTTAEKRNNLVQAAKNAAAATLAALSSFTSVKVAEQTTEANIEESALVHSESLNNEGGKDEEEVEGNDDQVPRDDEIEHLPANANANANPTEVTTISTTIATNLNERNDVAMDVVNGNSSLNSPHQNASISTTIDELGGEGEGHVVRQKSKDDNDKPPTAVGEGESNNKKISSETNVAETSREGNHSVQAKSNEDNKMSTVLGEGESSIKIIAVEKGDGRSPKEKSLSSSTEDMNAKVDSNVTNDETQSDEKPLLNGGTSNAFSASVGHSTSPIAINGIGKEKEGNIVTDEAINSKGIVTSTTTNIGSPYTSAIIRDNKSQIDIPALLSSIPNNAAPVVATTIVVSTAVGTTDNIIATATDIEKAEIESGEKDGGSLSQPVLGKKRPRSGDVKTTTTTNTEESHPQTTETGIANHVNKEEDQRREEVDIKVRATDAKIEPICEDATSVVEDSDRSEKDVRDEKNVPNTEQSKITVEEIDRGTESLVSKKVATDDSDDDPQQAGDVIETTYLKRKTDTIDEEQHDEDGTEGIQTQPKKRARTIGKDDNDVQNIIPDANADTKESYTNEISVSRNDELDKSPLVEEISRTNLTTNVVLQVGVISETMNTTNLDDEFNVMADKPQIDQLQIAEVPSFNQASVNGEVTTQADPKSTDDGATETFVIKSLDKSVDLADDGQTEFSDLRTETTAENSSHSKVTSQVEKSVGCEGSKAVGAVDIQTSTESGTRHGSFKVNTSDRNVGPAEESVVPTNDNDQEDTNTTNIQEENVRNDKANEANNLVSKTACDSDDITMVSRDETVREKSVKVFGDAKTDESNFFNDGVNKLKVAKEQTTAKTDSGSLIEDETHRSDRSSGTHVSDKKTESMSQQPSKETEGFEEEEPGSSRDESISNEPDCSSVIEKLATESIESGVNAENVANTASNDTHREDGIDIEANPQEQVPLAQTADQDEHEELVADGPHATGVLENIVSDAKTWNSIKSSSSKIYSSQSDETGRNHAKTSATEESNIADSDPVSSSLLASRDTDPIQMSASTAMNTLAEVVTAGANDMHVDGATHMDVDDTVDSMAEVDTKDATRMDIEITDETRTQKEPLPETDHQIESNDEITKEDSTKNSLDSKEDHLTTPNQKLSTENSTEVQGLERPSESRSVSGILHDEPDSTLSARLETETTVHPEESEPKVAWVEMSKAKRGPIPVEGPSSFNGFDESKMNRVKMLLYSAGSQIHRGRGFERIFSIYWDAVRLRLSGPQSTNISKQCDEAIAAFLKSKRLRKIHNRFIMGIMRRVMKNFVPYSEVSEHIPLKWQARVKIPKIVNSMKPYEKENTPLYGPLNDMLQISSVPHLDEYTPYKERLEQHHDATYEMLQNPQEGAIDPCTSSCIPGALVVDPFYRDTAEENGLKVTDNAIWVLTVALKEHVKNILNDSIKFKKCTEKAEIYPPSLHYPNLLSSVANKIRKESKGKTATAPQEEEVGPKKQLNSMDIFSALNLLPSGHIGSTGGSVSRVSIEQTFLSAFNSMPSFIAGNDFRDVQGFISNKIMVMAKSRKPGEKKTRVSHIRSVENKAETSRQARPTSQHEEEKITETSQAQLPGADQRSSSKSSDPTVSVADSPAFVHQLSPTGILTPVLTPVLGSDLHGVISPPELTMLSPPIVDKLQSQVGKIDPIQQQLASCKPSPVNETKGTEKKIQASTRVAPAAVTEKQVGNATTNAPPEPQRSGAGRGAKNLAALIARASSEKEPSEEEKVEKTPTENNSPTTSKTDNNMVQSNNAVLSEDTSKEETKTHHPILITQENGTVLTKQLEKPNAEQSKQGTGLPKNGESTDNKSETGAEKDDEAQTEASSSPKQHMQGRGGKPGKGFGTKDLAAMRARSLHKTETVDE